MKVTVTRTASHQGVAFVEVREFNDAGLPGPLTYAVPGNYPLGTVLEITVEEVAPPEELSSKADDFAEVEVTDENKN